MLPANLLSNARIDMRTDASSKKKVLEEAARLLVAPDFACMPEKVFEKLLERERLGSTGLGNGFAIPHARSADIDSPRGAFLRLQQPIDFDSLDGQPTDLICALLVPEEASQQHLDILAQLAKAFSKTDFCDQVRQLGNAAALIDLLTDKPNSDDQDADARPPVSISA